MVVDAEWDWIRWEVGFFRADYIGSSKIIKLSKCCFMYGRRYLSAFACCIKALSFFIHKSLYHGIV